MADCDPTYTNQGLGAFADGEYVTTDMLRKFCQSLAYLKEVTDILETQVDPQLNKVFTPISIDPALSYGMVLNGNNYTMSDQVSYSFVQLFNTLEATPMGIDPYTGLQYPASPGIDIKQTTAFVDLEYPISGEEANGAVTLHPLSGRTISNYDYVMSNYYRGPNDNEKLNACWEIGWDKTKPYAVKATDKANKFNANIPSIARSIVFEYTGAANKLVSDITVKPSGMPDPEDELYLELRNVTNGKPGTTVLGRTSATIKKFSEVDLLSFAFPHPIRIRPNTYYAIVVRSPLTTWEHRFGLGGWGFYCGTGAYGANASTKGNCSANTIFTSYDNCHTWMAHGKVENLALFHERSQEPSDFLFEVTAVTEAVNSTLSYTSGQKVYLNPINCNPITSVQLTADANIATGQSIVYEIATNLGTQNWTSVSSGNVMPFNAPYPTTIYVRATLNSNSATTTPVLKEIALNINTQVATQGYIRSNFYYPPTSMPLGMIMWSQVHAPYTQDPNTTVAVDIMESNQVADSFTSDGTVKTYQLSRLPAQPLGVCTFIMTASPYTHFYLIENQDFVVDYTTGIITSTATGTMEQGAAGAFIPGTLNFQYYPLFAYGLTESEFPYRCDYQEATITPANYATETQTATAGQTVFTMATSSVDYIYKVTINGVAHTNYTVNDTNNTITFLSGLSAGNTVVVTYNGFVIPNIADPILSLDLNGNELVENKDYIVNYMTNIVTLNNLTVSTDVITIGYTPYLSSRGLALNYRVSRSNTANNVEIGPSEYQYRV